MRCASTDLQPRERQRDEHRHQRCHSGHVVPFRDQSSSRIASALLTSNFIGASTASFFTTPSSAINAKRWLPGAEADAGAVHLETQGLREIRVAIGDEAHLVARAALLAPGLHHERVVDRHADDVVDALGLDLVGLLDEAGQVLVRAGRSERARHREQHDLLPGEQLVGLQVAHVRRLDGDGGDLLAFLDGHGCFPFRENLIRGGPPTSRARDGPSAAAGLVIDPRIDLAFPG